MVDVTLNVNFDDVIDEIDDVFKRQIPYAAFLALNDTAYHTSQDVRSKLMTPKYIQGGPVAFTKRGIRYKKAKDKHNLSALIYIPDEQWKYLMWLVRGGDKRWLRSSAGIGVPISENVKFNKFGNIPGRSRKEKLWREILQRGSGRIAAPMRGSLGAKQFIGTSKNGTTGLWQRTPPKGRGKPKLLVFFTKKAVPYKPTLPFRTVTAFYAQKNFKKMFDKRLNQVIQRESRRRI